MKKFFIIPVLILSLISTKVQSQSCLPDGITFTTQAEIDNFQTINPGCTEIEGEVKIRGSYITNLNGLNVLTAIGGDLKIYNTQNLHNLAGLDNLTIIGGDIKIGIYSGPGGGFLGNDSLANISSLDLLETASGELLIIGNPLLTSLNGLHNITNIQGKIRINWNSSLNNLSGLGSLTNIVGDFFISGNQSMENLIGLENLISIEGDLRIGGVGYFDSPDKAKILNNPSLTSLEGLNNLTSIGGDLFLGGLDVLINLDGLENLNSIGGQLHIISNSSLNSLTGLQNLTTGVGVLQISGNNTLTSLSGLDNINSATIISLEIVSNDLLTTCEVQCICDYLVAPNGEVHIYNNAPGCNSQQEVEEACATVSIDELDFSDNLILHPNPFSSYTTIEYNLQKPSALIITIHNHLGERVYFIQQQQSSGPQQITWDAEGLPSGVYYFRLQAGEQVASGKMLLVR